MHKYVYKFHQTERKEDKNVFMQHFSAKGGTTEEYINTMQYQNAVFLHAYYVHKEARLHCHCCIDIYCYNKRCNLTLKSRASSFNSISVILCILLNCDGFFVYS